MKGHGRQDTSWNRLRSFATLAPVAVFFAVSARADWLDWRPSIRSTYRPENVWRLQSQLEPGWRRVAVLPVTTAAGVKLDEDSRRMLQETLRLELTRGGQFEVVEVPASRLQSWIGQTQLRTQEEISAGLFAALKNELAADLVLFAEISEFKAYTPLRVGWHLKLVEVSGTLPVWEADELFDAAEPAVSRGAVRHDRDAAGKPKALRDGWIGRHSPRQFAEYSARTLVATLPRRTASDLR